MVRRQRHERCTLRWTHGRHTDLWPSPQKRKEKERRSTRKGRQQRKEEKRAPRGREHVQCARGKSEGEKGQEGEEKRQREGETGHREGEGVLRTSGPKPSPREELYRVVRSCDGFCSPNLPQQRHTPAQTQEKHGRALVRGCRHELSVVRLPLPRPPPQSRTPPCLPPSLPLHPSTATCGIPAGATIKASPAEQAAQELLPPRLPFQQGRKEPGWGRAHLRPSYRERLEEASDAARM